MIISQKFGNVFREKLEDKKTDFLELQWYETQKRIMRKRTRERKEVAIRFLDTNPSFVDGDIIYENGSERLVIEIQSCRCILIPINDLRECAGVAYEIGNRHAPLFFVNDQLATPFENPLFLFLKKKGYKVREEQCKLQEAFTTTVVPYVQMSDTLEIGYLPQSIGADV